MGNRKMQFLGIVVTGGSHPFTCVFLDDGLRIDAVKKMNIEQVDDFINDQEAVITVNAPSGLHKNLMADDDIRKSLSDPPKNGRFTNLRVADYELLQLGVKISRVSHEIRKCPVWMKSGFLLYDMLREKGYRIDTEGEENTQLLEVNAEAVFLSLFGFKPYDIKSLEGRIQRQLLLFEKGLDINDPMEYFQEVTRHRLLQGTVPFSMIYSSVEIAAMATAYMAWFSQKYPQKMYSVGHENEGLVFLPKPVNMLKA